MTSTLSGLLTLAASGTASVTVPVGKCVQSVSVSLNALYAAVAATTGVQATFQVSNNGGSTYTNAAEGQITASGVVGTVESASQKVAIEGPLVKNTVGDITHVKVNLTNLDATNAATVAVLSEASVYA